MALIGLRRSIQILVVCPNTSLADCCFTTYYNTGLGIIVTTICAAFTFKCALQLGLGLGLGLGLEMSEIGTWRIELLLQLWVNRLLLHINSV